ncbi:MAG: hypothetical protein O7D91_07325 [Planctomycetota bacterium]|nr:hypothetical protein [Planctomycetota bacterium]
MATRISILPLIALLGWSLAGCEGPAEKIGELNRQIATLQSTNRKHVANLEAQDKEIEKLKEAKQILGDLKETRLDKLYSAKTIKIDRLSGGLNIDGVIGDEGLVVYASLYDQEGHKFKAAGAIDVFVYDLSNPRDPQRIATYEYDVDQTKELWFGRMLTYHYKIECLWQQRSPAGRSVRVSVRFLDYLTGNVLQASADLEVTPPLASSSANTR